MRYIFLFATSCYSSLLCAAAAAAAACCCGVCCCCCCCVSQAVWVTNDKTKTCRGAVCDDDKDLVVRAVSLPLPVSVSLSVLYRVPLATNCSASDSGSCCSTDRLTWLTALLSIESGRLALVHANCTLIDFRCMFCLHFDYFIRCRCRCSLLLLFLLLLLPLLSLASLCDPKLNKWLFSAEPRQMASHRTRNSEADFVCFQRSAAFCSLLLFFLLFL